MENTNWVGVDTHKDTLACYTGNKFKEFKTTPSGFKKALEWAGNSKWAIEGAYCFGKPFASFLMKNNCKVYEIHILQRVGEVHYLLTVTKMTMATQK